ncbi:fasciclin domain-containing protein [Brevundimonas viscosa]|uniref:Uncaracterized surface protein containing fasciclin (FAS1) repeats n=1 Tax=Brevundimonas viscosa TaxID=871741 RepID=A0A1I6SGH7_9CAUL|nr:fasciclin domain-containing protein [Brevundimonas viscosa]SFS76057.1 Uncaracterized surface protein containing fasciclin (FAS1) repeats [Brevundimonas viscosa]
MPRSMLLAATAASALLAAPAVLAQTPPQDPPAQAEPAPAAATQSTETAQASSAESASVIDVLRARGGFTTLLAALDRAGLTETLASRPAISIFAPTDAAFAALPEEERTRLLDPANAAELRERLLYHVIVADVASGQIEGTRGGVQTAAQTEVQLDGTGDSIKVDRATVVQADIGAANGAIFAIDQVLDPGRSLAAMGDSEAAAGSAAVVETPAEAPADEAVAEEAPRTTPPTLPAERTAPDAAPTAAPSPATANPAPAAPTAPDTAPTPGAAPAAASTPAGAAPPAGVAATTRSAAQTAPTARPAARVVTVQSPPVRNPTDGQVDDEEDPLNPAPTPDE